MVGIADSVLIREVPFIQSVLYREAPLYLVYHNLCQLRFLTHCTTMSVAATPLVIVTSMVLQ